jgi:hypothetical protein
MGKKKALKKVKPQGRKVEEEKELSDEKQFDFGGIPARDLKKNLGCG